MSIVVVTGPENLRPPVTWQAALALHDSTTDPIVPNTACSVMVDGEGEILCTSHAVDVQKIPPCDPRAGLAGQLGVFARQPLLKGTVIGEYTGWQGTLSCFENEYAPALYEQSLRGQLEGWPIGQLPEAYTINLQTPSASGDGMVVCGLGCGSLPARINDGRVRDGDGSSNRPANLCLAEVVHQDVPRLFVVTITDIPANEELLLDYGEDYWQGLNEWLNQ